MPRVVTVAPTSGDEAPGPWISAMVLSDGGGGGFVQAVPQATGLGAPAVKSAALLAVLSWVALRETELVLLGAGVGPVPAKSLAVVPKPTKSTTAALPSQSAPQLSAVVGLTRATLPAGRPIRVGPGRSGGSAGGELTSATLPAVPLIAMVPVTSEGTSVVPPVPWDSRTM